MKLNIIDLFEVHERVFGEFNRFNNKVIILLKRIADRQVCTLSEEYDVETYCSPIEDSIGDDSTIDLNSIMSIEKSIRNVIIDHHSRFSGLYTGIFTVLYDNQVLTVDFEQPAVGKADVRISTPVDVPVGYPEGTVGVEHYGRYVMVAKKYVYCDDDGVCDVVINGVCHEITKGLWERTDSGLLLIDHDDIRGIADNSSVSGQMRVGNKLNVSIDTPKVPKVPVRYLDGGDKMVAHIYTSGDYSSEAISHISVDLTKYVPAGGKKKPYPKYNDISVVINGVLHIITEPGNYDVVDDELVANPPWKTK